MTTQNFGTIKKQVFSNRSICSGKQFSRHNPAGETIYETKRIVDFLVMNKEIFPNDLIIECKWQQTPGSVDEKYPFLLWNITKTKIPAIVLLDGGGYKPGAKKWLQTHANDSTKLLGVFNMREFQILANTGLFTHKDFPSSMLY